MTATHIVNQDRDRVYPITCKLYPAPVVSGGILMGYNLMMGDVALGTFDDVIQTVEEIGRILRTDCEVPHVRGYSVGGFANWKEESTCRP